LAASTKNVKSKKEGGERAEIRGLYLHGKVSIYDRIHPTVRAVGEGPVEIDVQFHRS